MRWVGGGDGGGGLGGGEFVLLDSGLDVGQMEFELLFFDCQESCVKLAPELDLLVKI